MADLTHAAQAQLPLKPADFQILLVLLEGDLHGYGLMQRVEEQSSGRVRLEVGSLYRLIARMTDEGLIERAGDDEEYRRRTYAITDMGREVARLEAERLADVLRTARNRNLLSRSEGR
jgi:DNA-binding PadR family transcriptional regulator